MDYFTPSYSMPLWGWIVIGVGVAVIVLPIIIFAFYQIFRKMGPSRPEHEWHRSRRRIVCHLCRRTVSEENWSSGRHRRICAVQHRGLLATLRTPDAKLRCRNCSRRLRIWPDGGHEPTTSTFVCSGYECPRRGVPIRSGNGNRFACFRCNFNLCEVCAEIMLNSDSAIPGAAPVDRPPSYCLLIAKEEMKKDLKASKSSLPTYEEALEIEEKTPLNPVV